MISKHTHFVSILIEKGVVLPLLQVTIETKSIELDLYAELITYVAPPDLKHNGLPVSKRCCMVPMVLTNAGMCPLQMEIRFS